MKRILSVVLLLALCVSMITSCDSVTSALSKADKALQEAPYTVTMSMDFDCENATLDAVFDAMTVEFPVTVDGENLYMDMSTEVMGFKTGISVTVVDSVVYSKTEILGQSVRCKATLDAEQMEEYLRENNTELPVTSENFETLTVEKADGKQVITCTGITTEGLTAMNELLSDSLTALGAESAVGDLSLVITLADGKYESMALTASYSVTVAGETHTVSLTMNAKYSYEGVQPITAPTDADSYEDVSFDEIMGK